MSIKDCIKSFVGLSSRDCNCLLPNRPTDYNISRSGYFLDDMKGGVSLKFAGNAVDCGDNGVWAALEKARNEGIMSFLTDFIENATRQNTERYKAFKGQIGKDQQTQYVFLDQSRPYVGVELRPKSIKGGVFRLKNVSISVSTALPIDVLVYNSLDFGTPLHVLPMLGGVGVRRSVAVNHDLPTTDEYGKAISYYFVYNRGTAMPHDNMFSCGCGGENLVYDEYLHTGGFQVQGIADLEQKVTSNTLCATDNYTMSIIIKGEWHCEGLAFLCGLDPSDYGYGATVAKAIQLYAVNALITGLSKSNNVNFYTLLNTEVMAHQYNSNAKELREKMTWLAQNIPADGSDCYICKESQTLKKVAILI